jgi:hypothetical protein
MWESIASNGVVRIVAVGQHIQYKRRADGYMNKPRYGGGDQVTYVLQPMATRENKNGD